MGKLTCGCLNVQIHAKCHELSPVDRHKLGLAQQDTDEFFQMEISEVQLDLEGIHLEHPCLVKQRQWRDWRIHRCLNCDLITHAIKSVQGSTTVLVNRSLKSDPTIQESLQKSPDFSPLYKIVIHSSNDNYQVKSLGLESGEYESLQKVLRSIQQQLNTFLTQEETAMEQRIRSYEADQKSKFAELQSKVRRHKNILISLVLAAEEEQDQYVDNDVTDSPENSSEMTLVEDAARKPTLLHKVKPPAGLTKPKVVSSTLPANMTGKNREDLEELDVFDLDELQDDSHPFYTSDDDNDDTDDSSNDDVFGRRGGNRNQNAILSSSMPISVPHWRKARAISNVSDDEDSEKDIPNQQDMAASIKALAQSVHGDGTEIFGDLPRRRINTLDMGKL